MSCSKVIRDELYKMSFYKVSKTRFIRKRSLFFRKRKVARKKFFYQFVFRKTVFLLDTFSSQSLVDGWRKSKNNVVLQENDQVSVIRYFGRMGMKTESKKHERYIILKKISGSTKWPIRYSFFAFFWYLKNFVLLAHLSIKYDFFTVCAS
jgi:hypothetical protein